MRGRYSFSNFPHFFSCQLNFLGYIILCNIPDKSETTSIQKVFYYKVLILAQMFFVRALLFLFYSWMPWILKKKLNRAKIRSILCYKFNMKSIYLNYLVYKIVIFKINTNSGESPIECLVHNIVTPESHLNYVPMKYFDYFCVNCSLASDYLNLFLQKKKFAWACNQTVHLNKHVGLS